MRYLYKQTGVVVESSSELDSTLFSPIEEKAAVTKEKPAETKPQEGRQSKGGKGRGNK